LSFAVTLLCVPLFAAAPASAAWTPPVKISALDPSASEPQLAVDAAGDLTAVWVSGLTPNRAIRSASRMAGGSWEAPSTLISSSSDCHDPRLAVNSPGAAIVVADCGTGATAMRGAYRPAGGAWAVSDEVLGSGSGEEPRVGLDGSGNATVVWAKTDKTVQSSYRPPAGPWGAAQQVSPAGNEAFLPQVAVNPVGGTQTAIWLHKVSASITAVETKDRLGSGAWSGAVKVLTLGLPSEPQVAYEPQVRWNAANQRIAAWAVNGTPDILQSHWGGLGSWSEEISIKSASDGVNDVEAPQIAIDGQGRAVAVWRIPGFFSQAATTSSLGGAWSSPAVLVNVPTGGFSGTEPQLAIDPAGNATAVQWASGSIYVASRPAGGTFAAATPIAVGTIEPQVAMDVGGDAFAAWSTGAVIEAALEDASPPVLAGIVVPVSAKTGASAAMSASASDSWSPPVTLNWSFGDGATATGAAVSHAYATAGTKTVSVTATDAVGNASAAQTRQIVVSQTPGETNKPTPVTIGVTVPKQSWKAIGKAKGVKLSCSLDVAGSCEAVATVTRSVASRLGLKVAKRAKSLRIGSGNVRVSQAGHATSLTVALTGKARAAIEAAKRRVPLTLTVTGRAPGRLPATLTRKLTIARP
jgi:hypothetical protein